MRVGIFPLANLKEGSPRVLTALESPVVANETRSVLDLALGQTKIDRFTKLRTYNANKSH